MSMRSRSLLLMFSMMLSLSGCGVPGGGQVLSCTILAQGDSLRVGSYEKEKNPALLVITNAQEIDDLGHNVLAVDPTIPDQRQRLIDQLRSPDYTRVFAILILQGQKSTGGYRVTVRQITRQADQVIVQAKFDEPGPGEGRTGSFTDPYYLITVNKSGAWNRQIRFQLVVEGNVAAETTHFIP